MKLTVRVFLVLSLLAAMWECIQPERSRAWSLTNVHVNTFSGVDDESIDAVTTDASGNIYVVGSFVNTTDFDPSAGTTALVGQGARDAYVGKYSSAGALIWIRQVGGTGDDNISGVAVDSLGSVYVVGAFNQTIDMDSGPSVLPVTAVGYGEGFILKLSATGNYVWHHSYGCGANSYFWLQSVAVDSSDRINVSGANTCTFDFDPSAGVMSVTGVGGYDAFIGQYNVLGQPAWVRSIASSSSEFVSMLATDSSGNIAFSGTFEATFDADSGPGTSTLTNQGTEDVLVGKLSSSGGLAWVKSVGGVGDDYMRSVAFGPTGDVYVTGGFDDAADFDPSASQSVVTPVGLADAFLLKLTSLGVYSWVRVVGGADSDEAKSVVVTADAVYSTGLFRGTADLDPSPDQLSVVSGMGKDIYLQKLSLNGNFVWNRVVSGAGYHEPNTILQLPSGALLVTGQVWGETNFDLNGGSSLYSSNSDNDAFFMLMTTDGVNVSTTTTSTTSTSTTSSSTSTVPTATGTNSATTSTTTSTTVVAKVQPKFKVKGSLKFSKIASYAGVTVKAGAKVSVLVKQSSAKVCAVKAGQLVAIKKGSCSLTLSVSTTSKGKITTKRAAVRLTVS